MGESGLVVLMLKIIGCQLMIDTFPCPQGCKVHGGKGDSYGGIGKALKSVFQNTGDTIFSKSSRQIKQMLASWTVNPSTLLIHEMPMMYLVALMAIDVFPSTVKFFLLDVLP